MYCLLYTGMLKTMTAMNFAMPLIGEVPKMSLLVMFTLSYLVASSYSLRCSVCNSEKQPDCETTPPPSQECWDPGSGVAKTCIIRKEFDKNDKIIQFRRDCSTVRADKCADMPATGGRVCSEVCFTDDCNSSTAVIPSLPILIVSLISLNFLVYL